MTNRFELSALLPFERLDLSLWRALTRASISTAVSLPATELALQATLTALAGARVSLRVSDVSCPVTPAQLSAICAAHEISVERLYLASPEAWAQPWR